MKRSKSSSRWMQEHFADEYVRLAQKQGYRSRAIYKLEEIQQKDQLIKPGMVVVDLGAAPGGWCQLAVKHVGRKGRVIALDILPMDAMDGVEIITGDFREQIVLDQLLSILDGREVDLVLSDMAPNISGMSAVDQPRAMYLCELAVDFCGQVLKPGGDFLVKAFQGEGYDELVKRIRQQFKQVKFRKPKASRPRSKEIYILARDHKV